MNLHPCFLSILGILPNQLRTLLKDTGHQHREEALDDLSRTLFFSGYDIWAKGNALPLDTGVKSHQKIAIFTANQQRKHRVEEQAVQSKCKNPFHFLHRHCNLSKKRPTKCPCSRVKYDTRPIVHRDIRSFTFHLPNTSHQPRSETISLLQDNRCILPPPQQNRFRTQSDIIRRQHDRGKKRKATHASNSSFLNIKK